MDRIYAGSSAKTFRCSKQYSNRARSVALVDRLKEPTLTSSSRKLAGTVLLLLFLVVYVLAAMAVAIVLQVNASKFVELIYYVLAGTLWVPVAAWIISWMYKPSAPAPQPD